MHNPAPGSPQERFNNAHTSIRSLIERCNGVLKNRFRCLIKHRILHYSPQKASQIINACVVLHNICIQNNIQLILDDNEENIDNNIELGVDLNQAVVQGDQGIQNRDLAAGAALRQHIIDNYFT